MNSGLEFPVSPGNGSNKLQSQAHGLIAQCRLHSGVGLMYKQVKLMGVNDHKDGLYNCRSMLWFLVY